MKYWGIYALTVHSEGCTDILGEPPPISFLSMKDNNNISHMYFDDNYPNKI
jgi:hypothetical protein